MNIVDYVNSYQNYSFKEKPFNELDALVLTLMSYFPYSLLNKSNFDKEDVLDFLKTYQPENKSERKLLDIYILKILCTCTRYSDVKFMHFVNKRSQKTIEQFQAISFKFKDFLFVSFCGTDASTLGWKEDFNMAVMSTIPSEVDAVEYINRVRRIHPFIDMYIGGHSKGGRLAIRAFKEVYKKNTIKGVYSYDNPNFDKTFYDEDYLNIKDKIREYAPNESIIGRLICDNKRKIIVKSNAKLLMQHDAYSWEIENNHFVREVNFTQKSDKISTIINETLEKLDHDTKFVFINAFFSLMERLDIFEFRDSDYNKKLVLNALSNIRIEWKNTPVEERRTILKVLWAIIVIMIKTR